MKPSAYIYPGLPKKELSTAEKMDLLAKAACEVHSIEFSQVFAKAKETELCTARQEAMYLMRTLLGIDDKRIGEYFGFSRAAACNGCNKIKHQLKTYEDTRQHIEQITELYKSKII